jgi:hypothetical protein
MKNKVFDYYKELPAWAKGVVIVGGIAIVYFTTKQFIGKIKKQAQKKKDSEAINTQKAETKKLEETGLRASYNDSQYNSWADKIQSAFKGCDFSAGSSNVGIYTDSANSLYTVLNQLKNDIDFLKLQTAWGVSRKYPDCAWGSVEGNLNHAVADELADGEIAHANSILAKKGITYRF